MRNVKWIFVILFIALVSFVDKDNIFNGKDVGDKAPQFMLSSNSEDEHPLSLDQFKGNYVLLSFWASYDAASRMQNVQLSKAVAQMPSQVRMVSVSFDEYRSVFDETIKRDRIDPAICFVELEGEKSSLYKQYGLKKGFKNYLLNPDGIIIAKDVKADEIAAFVKC